MNMYIYIYTYNGLSYPNLIIPLRKVNYHLNWGEFILRIAFMIRTLPISCGFSSIIIQPQLRTPWSWYSIFSDPFCASTTHLTHT